METHPFAIQFETIGKFFNKSMSVLSEKDSGYKPQDEMMTVAQQIRHSWMTIEWFNDGTFSGKGFTMDFEDQMKKTFEANSFDEEMRLFNKAIEDSIKLWSSKSMEELQTPIENDNIMGGAPKVAIPNAISDHTAHHRGSLVVYARMLGKVPDMPYDVD